MNLEIKYHCHDFTPIREVLLKLGATCEGTFDQRDYYFNLPVSHNGERLKYRNEGDTRTLVFYTRPDFKQGESAQCQFKFIEDASGKLFDILKEALGVGSIVQKRREAWRNGPIMFHLDQVETVGRLFEIEYPTENPKSDEAAFQETLHHFIPFLGVVATSSNADLVNSQNVLS